MKKSRHYFTMLGLNWITISHNDSAKIAGTLLGTHPLKKAEGSKVVTCSCLKLNGKKHWEGGGWNSCDANTKA